MPQIRVAPPLLLAAAFTCATRWPLDAQAPVRSDPGASAIVEHAAPSTARGILLPGSSDLARLRFESSPIHFHVVADRNSNGDAVRRDFGGTQKDYVPTSYQGASAIMIVLSRLGGRQPFVDSALVRRDGLAPIWEVQHLGSKRTRYEYDGAIVRRTVTTPDSSAAQSTTTYPFRVFHFNELDEVVRSVPLRPGYRAIVPLFSEGDNALETDSVDVEGTDKSGVWSVRFADKVIIGHYGIDGANRKIVRYEVNRHADKAHFCYIFGSDSTRACTAPHAIAAQGTQPGTPPVLVVRGLEEASTRYRLVPDGRRTRDTTSWTVTRHVVDPARGLGLQVMTAVTHGDTAVDSVLFNARTLIPVWEHAHGRQSWNVGFGTARITGHVSSSGSADQPIDVGIPGFAYSSTMDNTVVCALPLRGGYQVVLTFWDGDHLETDTVRVRALGRNSTGPWVVDFLEPYATETLWIDRSSRRVLRHEYVYARNGSRAHVEMVR